MTRRSGGVSLTIGFGSACVASVIAIAACGGKVDGSTQQNPSPSPTLSGPIPLPTGGPVPPNPGPFPALATAAVDIANAYCTTFANCCQSSGQPPIDIARCREVTAATVNGHLDTRSPATPLDLQRCIAAVQTRTSACGAADIAWAEAVDFPGLAIFAPRSIRSACETLVVAGTPTSGGATCSPKAACKSGGTCAIDECTLERGAGEACPDDLCLDGLVCKAATCAAPSLLPIGATCKSGDDCQLGLVCASNACATARAHASQYEERHSPYRVGFDTCRIFQYL